MHKIKNLDATSKREFFVGGIKNPETVLGYTKYDYYDTPMSLAPAANTWYTYREFITDVLPKGFYEINGVFSYSVNSSKTFIGEILANNLRVAYCLIGDSVKNNIRPISGFREIELTESGIITVTVRFQMSNSVNMTMYHSSLKVVRTR